MILLLAWRNIWRNKSRSIVIMVSVVIGLLAGISVLALYDGMMKSRVRTVIDTEVSHLQLHSPLFKQDYHPKFILPGSLELIQKLRADPAIKLAAPRTIVNGMLSTTTGSAGVQVNGVIPGPEYEISRLKEKIVQGNVFNPAKKGQVMIGKKLADKMKLKLNSRLVVTFTDTSDNIVSSAFRVCAIYQSGNAPLDELNIYVQQPELNELLLTGNSFHEIALLLYNDNALDMELTRLKKEYPQLLVESWKEISPETDLMVDTIDTYSYIIMIIILIALSFGILNTMLMSVLERTREIGMMVALGTSRGRIFSLVFLETLLLTIAGTPLGIGIGYFITEYFGKQGLDLSGMGEEMMASFGYSTMIYPYFPWDKLIGILVMVVGTAIISCILPSIKALNLQPVDALRR